MALDVGLDRDAGLERETEEPLPSALRGSLEATFGADLGDVRVHHGGDASRRAAEHDAHAFALGSDIYFGAGEYKPGTRDGDHLIAHEAAHVVQQRGGSATVQRKAHTPDTSAAEHEADHAADLAVARMHGGAAGGDRMAALGPAPSGRAMHKNKQTPATEKKGPDEKTLRQVSDALVAILIHHKSAQYTGEYQLALQYLEWGALEKSPYSVDERLEFLKAGTTMLAPVFTAMKSEQRWLSWFYDARIESRIAEKRAELNMQKAAARVEGVTLNAAAGPEAIDPNAPNGVEVEAKKAREAIKLHLQTASAVANHVNSLVNADGVKGEFLAVASGKDLAHAKLAIGLDAVNDSLSVALGLLELTDEEFWQKQQVLANTPGLEHVKTRLDLVKAVVELLNAGVAATSKAGRLIATQFGRLDIAKQLEAVGDFQSRYLGGTVAAITIVHSAFVIFSSSASDQEKIDAAFGGLAAVGQLGAAIWENSKREVLNKGLTGALPVGPAFAIAGTSISATYALAKYSAELYWAARSGIMKAQTDRVFQTMAEDSAAMVMAIERLVATGTLLELEQDEEQKVALSQLQQDQARKLGAQIDWFLERAKTYKYEMGAAYRVGSYRTLREIFEPLQQHAGKRDPEAVLAAATAITKQIAWCFENSSHIVRVETEGGGLEELNQRIEDERKEKENKG